LMVFNLPCTKVKKACPTLRDVRQSQHMRCLLSKLECNYFSLIQHHFFLPSSILILGPR
jgi:hypothetical protein